MHGDLMDGLNHQTVTRLDAIAATARGPHAAHTRPSTYPGYPSKRPEAPAFRRFWSV